MHQLAHFSQWVSIIKKFVCNMSSSRHACIIFQNIRVDNCTKEAKLISTYGPVSSGTIHYQLSAMSSAEQWLHTWANIIQFTEIHTFLQHYTHVTAFVPSSSCSASALQQNYKHAKNEWRLRKCTELLLINRRVKNIRGFTVALDEWKNPA